jgi:ABC-type antimicrobial peptide transport system permease subunit
MTSAGVRARPAPRRPGGRVGSPGATARSALGEGVALLRSGGRRSLLAAAGVALAATMLGTAVTVGWSLQTGFDRAAAAADLPDVIARFDRERRSEVEGRLRALPNVAAVAFRTEIRRAQITAGTGTTDRGVVEVVGPGRRGYAIVAGRDVREGSDGDVVVERGVARAWGLHLGDPVSFGRFGTGRVVGIAVGPDNVAYPLASAPRVYVATNAATQERFGVNVAMVWARDPSRVDITLQQARATSFGITDLRFITRDGVRILLDRAAGIVLALLVAFAVIVLGAAGVMLGVAAHADVQRRLQTIGVQRALGFPRATIVGAHAARAALIAVPSAAAGLALGALLAAGPTGDLLATLNELAPGAALAGPLAIALAACVALVAAASAWPALRATSRSPVALLRGGEVAVAARRPRDRRLAGPLRLGARLAVTRRGRFAGTVLVLGTCVAIVALLLALASLLVALRDDPGALGKRYDTTVSLPASSAAAVRRIPGVQAAAPRYEVQGADSYALGEPVRLVAFPGDHTVFEAPPLASGRRLRANDEAEVGVGLADALNLRLGGTLAVQLEGGGEVRFRIVGLVRALDDEGRIAYVRPARLLRAASWLSPQIAVRTRPGANQKRVSDGLLALGATPVAVGGATSDNARLLDTLAALLRVVAGVTALVCLYALVQALALVALERRQTIALLRATGAGLRTVALLLAGVVLAAAIPAIVLGLVVERFALAPAVGALAAGYADLAPRASAGQALLIAVGVLVLCAIAAAVVARRAMRVSIVSGLRRE